MGPLPFLKLHFQIGIPLQFLPECSLQQGWGFQFRDLRRNHLEVPVQFFWLLQIIRAVLSQLMYLQ